MKRQDYISWDEYFMGIALLTAQRSKDNSSQVGACIVSRENKILSLGYNGMPIGCLDDEMPWGREGTPLDTKYMYVCHAELNAILNHASGTGSLRGARIYTTLFPCNECAKALIQSGIREVIYYEDKYHTSTMKKAAAASRFHCDEPQRRKHGPSQGLCRPGPPTTGLFIHCSSISRALCGFSIRRGAFFSPAFSSAFVLQHLPPAPGKQPGTEKAVSCRWLCR